MKKRKRLLVILSTFVMAAQPMCVAAEMQDAEGFGAVEEIWADEGNEEEFAAAPEVENEDLNGFQAEISTEENDRIEAEESGEIISGAIAGDSVDSGISLFSLDYYTDSYGAQLDGNAKALYDLLVQNYVVDYSQYLESVDFPFEFPDTITFEAVVEDGSFQRKGESYVQATDDVKTAIQAASDAFSYDYPQAFWFRGSNYGYRVSCVRDGSSSTGYRGTFKNFTFKPANREISENAHTRMGDFMDGVQSAVAELNEQTLGMDMEQKIKRIHDYICQRVTYRNDNTLWVHSAASLFLDADPAFVCEGYAKSMKIFCYYMGINCACISGTARGTSSGTPGAHMWNYVQMDNGNWYLVDATWDDVGTPPSSRYLLVGRSTKGQYITIGEERVEYTSFSTTSAETAGPVFILPVLAEESYADNKGKNEPTVTVVPTVTPTAAVSAEPTPTVSAEPTPTVSAEPTPTVSVKPAPTVSAEPTPTVSVKPAPTVSVAPTPTVSMKPVPTVSAEPTPTASVAPTPTVSAEPTPTVSVKPIPIVSAEPTPTASVAPIPTVSVTPIPTATPVPTATPTPTTTTLTLRVKQNYKSGGKIKSVRTTNKKIVKVDKKGKITGKKAGKATVTITYTNGSRRIFRVKVQKGIVKTTSVSVNKRNIILARKGKSFQLKVTLTPVTSQQKVTYKSSNSKVAAVNSKGKIVAKKKGTATITVKSGNKKITCKVKVKK
ncbi:transglutaminase domain-containing protein [Blautia faecis]|uniref:transglutaminase domain-containing protein n=1 Tax=Blautia faecis TaxID=871665 RepID=UPI001D065A5A|nr:transglutaminase domain-containing protein [Blautia faecis]MCB6580512.1 Ig-like domain-containing protein [Blautia faecis]MCB7292496.1 Ig-like domain-containing protein [Blautia faecis]MCG4846840.1 Ig-like domain-containing protein [Blautia faecis]